MEKNLKSISQSFKGQLTIENQKDKKMTEMIKELSLKTLEKKAYTIQETAEIFGISLSSTKRAIKVGSLKAIHIGRIVRISAEEINRYSSQERRSLSPKEAAITLGVSAITIRRAIIKGKIKTFRIHDEGPHRISEDEIERILKQGIK